VIKIKVPATTANMGSGFDCIGIALDLHNELTVHEADAFSIEAAGSESTAVPVTKDNMIYNTIEQFYAQIGKTVPTLRLSQTDNIPMARGLGSSAACIVAGLLAANELSKQGLPREELAQIASSIEGHPDNVVPAILGGLVVGAIDSGEMKYVKITPSDELSFALFIPDFSLLTEKARGVLPITYSREDVIFNVSRASLFIASMMSGNWDNLRVATQDRIHQPYRKQLIPDWDAIFESSMEFGAKSVLLSGAGPTILAIVMKKHEDEFVARMSSRLESLQNTWQLRALRPDNEGAQVL